MVPFFLKFASPVTKKRYGILLAVLMMLISCAADSPQKTGYHTRKPPDQNVSSKKSEARITAIRLEVKKPFPRARIDLHIQGRLPDGCTHIERITQQRKADIFYIHILTGRASEVFCTQALIPFSRTVALDTEDLPSGVYQVKVHELKASFAIGDR